MIKALIQIIFIAGALTIWELVCKAPYTWLLNFLGLEGYAFLNWLGYAVPLILALMLSNAVAPREK